MCPSQIQSTCLTPGPWARASRGIVCNLHVYHIEEYQPINRSVQSLQSGLPQTPPNIKTSICLPWKFLADLVGSFLLLCLSRPRTSGVEHVKLKPLSEPLGSLRRVPQNPGQHIAWRAPKAIRCRCCRRDHIAAPSSCVGLPPSAMESSAYCHGLK